VYDSTANVSILASIAAPASGNEDGRRRRGDSAEDANLAGRKRRPDRVGQRPLLAPLRQQEPANEATVPELSEPV
jgi:hypothetical protein